MGEPKANIPQMLLYECLATNPTKRRDGSFIFKSCLLTPPGPAFFPIIEMVIKRRASQCRKKSSFGHRSSGFLPGAGGWMR